MFPFSFLFSMEIASCGPAGGHSVGLLHKKSFLVGNNLRATQFSEMYRSADRRRCRLRSPVMSPDSMAALAFPRAKELAPNRRLLRVREDATFPDALGIPKLSACHSTGAKQP